MKYRGGIAGGLMKRVKHWGVKAFAGLALLLPALLMGVPQVAIALTAATLGDYENVTVMQVSGGYDVGYLNGYPDMSARRTIAKEFYRTHGDDYDMLVIFTNFDFVMPPGAKAFYSPAKNDIRGIGVKLAGQELFDYTNAYSPTGAYLARLNGTIDMANISSHVLEPTDPEFDDTMLTLTHEFLHRWGAYVRFRDGASNSVALLGKDDAHWSYLLDSGGSTLYGNNWRDNGDGTFTSIAPEQIRDGEVIGRIFSPLDLYLMGVIDKSQVPPLLLINAPGVSRTQLPAIGETITGMARTITIDDIIAAEGERIPNAANSRKEFRIAFIYAVTPGTWSASSAEDRGEVAAINRLQTEWEKRFSILTDGAAMMRTAFVVPEAVDANPGVTTPAVTPATTPSVNNSVNWLVGRQQPGGFWQDQPGTDRRDTAAAVNALKPFPAGSIAAANGQGWLATITPENSDFLARKLLGLDSAGVTELVVLQNADGGWGSAPGYGSNPVDTALVLQVLTAHGGAGSSVLTAAVNYLHGKQNPDGGWNAGRGGSMVQSTARALLALNSHRSSYPIEPVIADGLAWLSARQNGDGGFGNSPSTVVDTAIALEALKATGASSTAASSAVNYLLAKQSTAGSWNDSVFQTAQAVEALHAGQVAADLVVETSDIGFTPATVASVPATVTVTVTVHNVGGNSVAAAKVALFEDDPAQGNLLGEQTVSVPGSGSAQAVFSVTVTSAGLHAYFVTVDGSGQVPEANEWNNTASKTLTVNMGPPTVGFALAAAAASEAITSVPVAVTLSYPWPEPITINYAVNAASTAIAASDYTLAAGTLTFTADQTSRSINLAVVNDLVAESDKTVIIDLATPSVGTLGTARHTYTIRDDEPPAVTISSPPAAVIGQSAPQLLYTTTGGNVVVRVDGTVVAKVSGDTLDPFADGAHFVEVTASNSFGTVTTRRVDFTVDTSLPTVIINAPTGLQPTKTPLLDYLVDGATTVVVKIDNMVVNKMSGQALDPLTEGNHTLTITATNAAGRSNTATSAFVVDSIPPSVKLLFPNDGGIISEVNPTLLYRLSETGTVTVTLDGVTVAKQSGESLGVLTDGEHVVQVTLTDANGISAAARSTFVMTTLVEPAYLQAGSVSISGNDAAVDAFGNTFVLGQPGPSTYTPRVLKYDQKGQLLWNLTRWPSIDAQTIKGIDTDSEGNVYVGFTTWDGIDGISAKGYQDGYVAKFDANGNWVWSRQLATTYSDYVYDVHVDREDNIYVSGTTGGSLFSGGSGGWQIYVAKYNKQGTLQWGRQYTVGYAEPDMTIVEADLDGNVYLATEVSNDFLVRKYTATGSLVWSLQDGSSTIDLLSGIGIDAFGNLYVAGATDGAFAGYTNAGFFDSFLIRYNSQSTRQWVYQWGDANYNYTYGVAVEPEGDAYLSVNGLRKIDKNMNLIWSQSYPSTGQIIDSDGRGHIYTYVSSYYSSGNVNHFRDQRFPSITVSAVALTNQSIIPVSGTTEAGSSVVVTSSSNAQCGPVSFTNSVDWNCTLAGLSEGKNVITAEGRNPAGFRNRAVAEVVLDTIPPVITVVSPQEGQTYSSKPMVQYSINEGSAVVYLNGVRVTSVSYPLEGLLPGLNALRIEATDAAGNVSERIVTFEAIAAAVGERSYVAASIVQVGTSGNEQVDQVVRDGNGNVYMIGSTSGNLDGQANHGQSDVFVRKYDNSGAPVWTRLVGTANSEYGKGIVVNSIGDIYIVYETHYASVKGGSSDWSDMYLGKYDAAFNLQWSKMIGSKARDYASGLCLDPSGAVYVAGNTEGSINRQVYGGGTDFFHAKYDPLGTEVWLVQSGRAGNEWLNDIACGAVNSYLVTGQDENGLPLVDFFSTNMAGGTLNNRGEYAFPGAGLAITASASGKFYATGYLETANGKEIFVGEYWETNNTITFKSGWRTYLGTDQDDSGQAVAVGTDGSVYVIGYTEGSLPGQSNAGGRDVMVAKFGTKGEPKWTAQYGSTGNEEATAALTIGPDLLVAGQTDADFGGSSQGGTDLFVLRLEPPRGPVLAVNPVSTPTRATTQVISGTVSLPSSINVLRSPSVTISNSVTNPDGTWSFTVSDLIPNADNVLTINAVDSVGTTSKTVTIHVDTLPPSLAVNPVTSPTNAATQGLTGTIEAGATLTVEVNPPAAPVPVTVLNGTWSYTASLITGINTLTFTATDAAGNATIRTVTIDCRPPKLTVTPATVTQGTATPVTLTIEQFDLAVPTIQLKLVQDVAGDGSPVADPLARLFFVTDGIASSNPNVPGDNDGVLNGRIVTTLAFDYLNDVQMAPGDYVVMAYTTPTAVTTPFQITETSQTQTIQGYVLDPQNTPRGGATVQLLDKWGHSHGYAFTDSAGHYLLNVSAPGDYLLLPTLENFVFAKANLGPHSLASGQNLSVDLPMVAGTYQVDGQVLEAGTLTQIQGGVLVRAENDLYVAAPMTRGAGTYQIYLPAGDYALYADSYTTQGAGTQGYLGSRAPLDQVTVSAASTGNNLQLNKATALVCGQVRDAANMGIAGLVIEASTDSGSGQLSTGVTDADGNYCLGLVNDGIWQVALNDDADQPLGFVGTVVPGITAGGGPFSGVDLTVYPVEGTIEGDVRYGAQPVAGLALKATCAANGAAVTGRTAADGSYRLDVPAGTWQFALAAEALGYDPVAPVSIPVEAGGTSSRNFAVTKPVEPVTVTVNPVTSPTNQSMQTLGGSRSINATVTVKVNTTATIDDVNYPTATTWECTMSNLTQGPNAITVTASDGTSQATAPVVTIDYQPPVLVNTIAITKAAYDSRKKILNVEATSSHDNAQLQVINFGPMTFAKLFKGKYYWVFSGSTPSRPAAVTVSGPEGSTTVTVR